MLTATLKIAIREPQLHDVRVGRPPKNAKRRGGPQNEDEIYATSDRIRRRVARGNCLFSCVLPDNTQQEIFPTNLHSGHMRCGTIFLLGRNNSGCLLIWLREESLPNFF